MKKTDSPTKVEEIFSRLKRIESGELFEDVVSDISEEEWADQH